MKSYLFAFFFLFVLFSDEIFRSYLSARGLLVETGMYQRMYIFIAIISYCILTHDLFLGGKLKKKVVGFFTILCGVMILFGFTYLLYAGGSASFISSILYYGSVCMSAAACGMHLAIARSWKEIEVLLPFFLLGIGMSVGLFGMQTLMFSIITDKEIPLDYQTVSYIMSEIFGFSSYYIFFSNSRKSKQHNILRWPIFALMIMTAVIVVISGGRGGFVLLVVEIILLMWMLFKSNRIKKSHLVPLIVLGVIAFMILASKLSIFDTEGFTRISTTLGEDDNRKELYNIAKKSFASSPILGHGIGSVWMEVGFYCHNMLLDLLVEGGVIGALVALYIYFKTALKLWKWHRYNPFFIFLIFVFLKVFVMTLFSGYWLNALQLWLVFGFVYVASAKNYMFNISLTRESI